MEEREQEFSEIGVELVGSEMFPHFAQAGPQIVRIAVQKPLPLYEIDELMATIGEVDSHPNRRYWLLKTICLNNLYGMDLMGEAAEIAKLRLFLKLVAQLEDVSQIEPLPDLDFNIKAGNLLVGIADPSDVARRFGDVLQSLPGLAAAEHAAQVAADAYDEFASAQLSSTSVKGVSGKRRLANQIQAATSQADNALYDIRAESMGFEEWKNSHVPFHWFAEFPSVWRDGGFDVVIGNPPYINRKQVTEYTWRGYATEKCPDLYAVCMERASTLLNEDGRMAMIVMHSLCFNQGFQVLRKYLSGQFSSLWVSSFSRIPDGLFGGSTRVRNTIVIGCGSDQDYLASRCRRWLTEGRSTLFDSLEYTQPNTSLMVCGGREQWPFTDSGMVSATFAAMVQSQLPLNDVLVSNSTFELTYKKVAHYSLGVYQTPPPIIGVDGTVSTSPHDGKLYFRNHEQRDLALMVLAGRWTYLWWSMFGDDFNVTRSLLAAVPCDIEVLSAPPCDMEVASLVTRLANLAEFLKEETPKHLAWKQNAGVKVGRYDLRECRHITDEADWLLAQAWGLTREQYEAAGNLRDRMTFGSRA